MSPAELKKLNVEHFQRVLGRTVDPRERVRIERLIEEEIAKPDGAYPADHSDKGLRSRGFGRAD